MVFETACTGRKQGKACSSAPAAVRGLGLAIAISPRLLLLPHLLLLFGLLALLRAACPTAPATHEGDLLHNLLHLPAEQQQAGQARRAFWQ